MADKKIDNSTDIMADEPRKFSLFGHTKTSKIIYSALYITLIAVIIWCVIYQMG